MDEPLWTFETNGLTAEIYTDYDCESPRALEPLGTLVAWHGRYELADDPDRFPTPDDFHAFAKRAKPPIVLPVYLLDHSGLALSTTSFSDPWDSGQVGYIYADKRSIERAFGKQALSDTILNRARQCLTDEVKAFGDYVNGECYGYILRDAAGAEIDTCWGFVGWESAEWAARQSTADHAQRHSAALSTGT